MSFPNASSFVKTLRVTCFAALALAGGYGIAHADPVTFFDTIGAGRTSFDNQISAANGTLYTDTLTGLTNTTNTWVRADYTITSTNAANRAVSTTALNGVGMATYSGGGDAISMNADFNGLTNTGLTFTFNSAINGFGLELENWATCCYPSTLYISFDGGAPIAVGTAGTGTDNPGVNAGDGPRNFVAAIDDSGTFTVITFYGLSTGSSDLLNAGGIIRYAIVPLGSLSGNYVTTASPTPQTGLANYLDENDGSGDLADVAAFLNTASEEEVAEALKTIFPVNTSVTSQTMMGAMGQTTTILIDKVGTVLGTFTTPSAGFADGNKGGLSQWIFGDTTMNTGNANMFGGSGNDMVAGMASMPYKKFDMGSNAVWVEGVGAKSHGKSTTTSFGYDTASKGFVAGYEYALNENNLIGLLGSGFRTSVDIDNDAGDTDVSTYTLGVYAQHLMGATRLTGALLGGYGKYDSERNVSVGPVSGTPEGDYDSWSFSATAGISRLYEHNGLEFEPFATVNYSAVQTDDFTEQGGGAFNMSVSGDKFSTASIKAGVTVQHKTKIQDSPLELKFKPYVGYQWEIEEAGSVTRFAGTPAGGGVSIDGRDINTAEVGFAAEGKMEIDGTQAVKLGFDVSKDKNERRGVIYAGYGIKF